MCPVWFAVTDQDPTPNPAEVAELRWVETVDLGRAVASAGWAFSPWMVEQVRQLAELVSGPARPGAGVMTAQLLDLRGFAEFFVTGTERADGAESRALWEAMTDAADGGKRVRPDLLQATYEAFGGNRPEVARQVGDAIELLHTAFVMHDDVIDHDLSRRGRPNVSGAFEARGRAAGAGAARARRYGQAAGILAGDLALVGATRLVATADTDRRDGRASARPARRDGAGHGGRRAGRRAPRAAHRTGRRSRTC